MSVSYSAEREAFLEHGYFHANVTSNVLLVTLHVSLFFIGCQLKAQKTRPG